MRWRAIFLKRELTSQWPSRDRLHAAFRVMFGSLCRHTDAARVAFHMAADAPSRAPLRALLAAHCPPAAVPGVYDLDTLVNRSAAFAATQALRPAHGYYAHGLFLLAPLLHRVLPATAPRRLIFLDADLLFTRDIADLAARFTDMAPTQVMALAHEQQPVYYHLLSTSVARDCAWGR